MKLNDALAHEAKVVEATKHLNMVIQQAVSLGLVVQADVHALTKGVQISVEVGVRLADLEQN